MKTHFALGKLVSFVAANIVGGLLQVWVLYVALAALGKAHGLAVLLGDGGLFFFATSLTVNSFLILLAEFPGKLQQVDIVSTLFALIGGLITSVVFYIVIFTNRLGIAEPFHDQIGPQVGCAILALAYAVFASARTGYFRA